MKRGAPDHWKMSDLARRLKVPDKYGVTWANGALERLWHSARNTPLVEILGKFRRGHRSRVPVARG